jgi:hypothetical protein
MSNQPLHPVSPNKTVVFYTPFEGEDVIVRTGVLQEKNPLLHAVLHGYSKKYAMSDKQKRIRIAKKLEVNPVDIISEFYKQGYDTHPLIKKDVDKDVYQIIAELIPKNEIEKRKPEQILDYAEMIFNKVDIDKKKKKYFLEKFADMIEYAYKNSKDIFEHKIKRDIYIFDSTTRLPVKSLEVKKRKSMFVLQFDDGHYEILGKLLAGNKIQRVFSPDDNLVKTVNCYLTRKDSFDKICPDISELIDEERSSSRSSSGSSSQEELRGRTHSPSPRNSSSLEEDD